MSRVVLSSPSADRRLERAAAWLAERPEAHVTIVASSLEAAGEVARRALAKSPKSASFGWQRTTIGMLATTLARPELARRGLVPAGSLTLEAICARVVTEDRALGRFSPIAERPGLPRALARTLAELRLAGVKDPKDRDLKRLLASFEKALDAAGLADRARTFALAREALAQDGAPIDPKHAVLVLDAPLRTHAERDLLAALVEKSPATLAVLPRGDARALDLVSTAFGKGTEKEEEPERTETAVDRLQHLLFSRETPAARDVSDDELTFLSAPGESRECVEIARLVLREARTKGTPFDRMAVLVRTPQYGAHLAEAFRRAKVPAWFARGTRKPDPTGRALLALLACAAEGLSARRFAEYLSLGVVPDETKDGAPPPAAPRAERVAPPAEDDLRALVGNVAAEIGADAREEERDGEETKVAPVAEEDRAAAFGTLRAPRHWEKLLVDAAVIGGVGRWKNRTGGLARKLAQDLELYEKKGETALAELTRRDATALATLTRYALPLIADLDALPQEATWGEWIERLSQLASRAIRNPERVLAVLAELEPMAKVPGIDLTEVRLVLEPRLSQLLVAPPGRRYGKVFVATIEEARGLAFDVVFVPGLAEKVFPQKVVEDPLLHDEARRANGEHLPTNAERSDEERLALRLAVGAARRRVVVSYPRLDVEQARPRTPSFYGLELLRVAEGCLRDFEYLAKKAARTADARIGWPAPQKRDEAIDEAEFDLAVLDEILKKKEDDCVGQAHYLLSANDHLARALRFRGRRWLKAWKAADGLVDPPPEALEAIREHAVGKRSFSPTALQNFASCPYRFLLSAVHKLAPREEPEPIEDLDALTKGSLVHEVQYELLTKLRAEKMLPVTPDNLEAARKVLEGELARVSAEYKDRLNPAIERVWDDAMSSIAADLREWLKRMTDEPGWVPAHFELSFGLHDARAQDENSTEDPVELDIGLKVRGSIDLVEKTADGRLRATDSKTGKVRAKKDATVIGGGEILQPVLYALALERIFTGKKVEGGRLYYCTTAGGFEAVMVPLDDIAREAAKAVAKTIGESIEKGFLPAAPNKEGKGWSACTYCDFRTVCGPYEEIRTKRKPTGPLKALIELRRRP
jgi:ATP-dependent helicase/nuclease subunit B